MYENCSRYAQKFYATSYLKRLGFEFNINLFSNWSVGLSADLSQACGDRVDDAAEHDSKKEKRKFPADSMTSEPSNVGTDKSGGRVRIGSENLLPVETIAPNRPVTSDIGNFFRRHTRRRYERIIIAITLLPTNRRTAIPFGTRAEMKFQKSSFASTISVA